jgi:cation transport regulator ChaC
MAGRWVFGYGSLVSPVSFGVTLGRDPRPGVDFFEAELAGFGRRWNYGVMHTEGTTVDDRGVEQAWTIVALGLVAAQDETVNGIVGWVDDVELVALDRRERHYDRVDVTALATVHGGGVSGEIVTYVPRPEAQRHHEAARDLGRAAVEQRYWDLVDDAFAALGAGHRERYHATTPTPDVPVLELQRRPSPWQRR